MRTLETADEIGTGAATVPDAVAGRTHGAEDVPALIAALKNEEFDRQVAAARALGEVGDERAIGPLMEMLRRCFDGRSARWNLLFGVGLLAVTALVAALRFATDSSGLVRLFLVLLGSYLLYAVPGHFKEQRERSVLVKALGEALTRIAERTRSPQVRGVLGDLRAVAADVLQQQGETRRVSREAVARIEALTEELRRLPVASSSPEPAREALPLAGEQ